MIEHYGQHYLCDLCDSEAAYNSAAARAKREKQSAASAETRAKAEAMGLPQHIVNRAASLASDLGRYADPIAAAIEREKS